MKKLIIVGGGFGGIEAAKTLASNADFEITLLDRRNHHLFQPLLYQVATAGLSPAEISSPIRSILAGHRNIQVILGEVQNVDLANNSLVTDYKNYNYDYLILACGAQHSYFGHPEWEPHAPALKTLAQATEIRRRILLAFEWAERESNPIKQKQLLTFVIIGGGPTGVELAGTLGEITRFTLSRDFRKIDPKQTRIILVEAGSRILSSLPEVLSQRAARDLEKMGIQIWTQTKVTNINADGVEMGEEKILSQTILWAAGVEAASLNWKIKNSFPQLINERGSIINQADLSLAGFPHVFSIGDQCSFHHDPKFSGRALPGLAPVAMQQGRHAARNILRIARGQKTLPFRYFDKGQLSTIGRSSAVGVFGKLRFTGTLAWIIWLVVHIFYLIGFKNRVFVLFQWTWAYLTFRRGARLIVNNEQPKGP